MPTTLNYKYNVCMTKSNAVRNDYGAILTSTLSSQPYIQTGTVPVEYLIGTANENGIPRTDGLIGRIYRVKIGDNNRVVRDYVPVKRISDNVVGLYDLINKTFATTPVGTFKAGTEIIPTPEKPIAIKSVGKIYNFYNTTMEQGDIRTTTGALVTSATIVRSKDFIKIDGGTRYTILRKTTGTGFLSVRRYDINYNYLSYSSLVGNIVSIPENCAYIKFIDENNDLNMEYSIYKGYNNTYFEKGKTYIREKSYNNLLDLKQMENWGLPRIGFDITDKGKGIYNIKGTATSTFFVPLFFLNDFLSRLNPNKYYRYKYKISGNYGAARFDLFYFYKINSSVNDVVSSVVANSAVYNNFILKPSNLLNSWKFALSFYNFTIGQEYDFDIQVSLTEYGSEADIYSYNYDVEDFPLDEPLRAIEVPNTENYNVVKDGKYYIADYLDWKNKKVVRRIRTNTITGNTTSTITMYYLVKSTLGSNLTAVAFPANDKSYGNTSTIPGVFSTKTAAKLLGTTSDTTNIMNVRFNEGISNSSSNQIVLSILKTRISGWSDAWTYTQKLDAIISYLNANNYDVNYILATPTETPFTAEQEAVANLMSFENYTEIIVDDEVEPLNIELNYRSKSTKES